MKNLVKLVELIEDNDNCVLLKVKEGSELDMILLGCFDGDENMIRLAKDEYNTITIFRKNGTHYCWAGNECVVQQMNDKEKLIKKCVYILTGYPASYIRMLLREGRGDEIYV